MTFKARGLYASSSKEPGGFRRGPWLLLGGVLVVIMVVFTAVSVLGNVAVHQTDRTDSYDGVAVIRLDNSTGGRVQLHSGDGDEVLVERSLRGSPLSEPDEDISASGDRLDIDTGCSGILFFSSCSVNYDITVPAGTEVAVETISGHIAANGLDGDLNLQTVSGDVQVGDHVGAIEAEAISGHIDLERVEGSVAAQSTSGRIVATGSGDRLEVTTTSGEIDAADFEAGEISAESVSGQLRLGGGFTTLEASTVSGNVTVRTDTPFDLMQVETVSGSVTADVPDVAYDVTGTSVSGNRDFGVETSSGADSRIDVSTTSGGVSVSGN